MFVFKAAVVGAGTMGGEIAHTIANAEIPVVLKDVDQKFVDQGLEKARSLWQGRVDAGKMDAAELERKLNFVLDQLHLQYADAPLDPALAEAATWLRQGKKIDAIKAYQKMTGQGLREAKDAVEALEQKLNAG